MKTTLLASLFIFLLTTPAFCIEIDSLIKQLEDNLNGKTSILKISMQVFTKRTKRQMKMESYSVGNEKSFIKILYPKKDYGITFLKRDNAMWQYVPRIEKVIKIPASMMLQSWMGSDFSNDDLVKESSISRDYTATLSHETPKTYHVTLIPRQDAPVVWGKITIEIDKEYLLPTIANYYDEDDVLIRVLEYDKIQKIGDRYYPTHWAMTPKEEDKSGHKTIINITEAVFDEDIDSKYFTKRALKRFSR